jgi:hypothetical protein
MRTASAADHQTPTEILRLAAASTPDPQVRNWFGRLAEDREAGPIDEPRGKAATGRKKVKAAH